MTSDVQRILNLGCGNRLIPSTAERLVVNHDRRKHRPDIDVAWDLNQLPWPWEDEEFDEVHAWAVLEHLIPTLVESIDECWRLLTPGGRLHIKLPLFGSPVSHRDPTHRWFVTTETLDYFDPATELGTRYGFYTDRKWQILERGVVNPPHSYYAIMVPRKGQ